jgi:lipoate synthase
MSAAVLSLGETFRDQTGRFAVARLVHCTDIDILTICQYRAPGRQPLDLTRVLALESYLNLFWQRRASAVAASIS